jgi:hypothetical protein
MRPLCERMKAAKPSPRGVPDSAVSRVRLLLLPPPPPLLSRDLREKTIGGVIDRLVRNSMTQTFSRTRAGGAG